MKQTYFITGIGTDIGKSWATGWLARTLANEGKRVITQKFIQTGNVGRSEDIELHRRIMGIPLQPVDLNFTTAPIIFSYPASPHYASRLDNRNINLNDATYATAKLLELYDIVLIEGAGGVMVPISDEILTIDYIRKQKLPAIVVTNGKLGSISDTILTLEALAAREIPIHAVIYNPHFDQVPELADDARRYMQRYVSRHYPEAIWMEMPENII